MTSRVNQAMKLCSNKLARFTNKKVVLVIVDTGEMVFIERSTKLL